MQLSNYAEPAKSASSDTNNPVGQLIEQFYLHLSFRITHYIVMDESHDLACPLDGSTPATEIVRDTRDTSLSSFASSPTHCHTGKLKVPLAQFDQLSNDQVKCGIGSEWHARGDEAFGTSSPDVPFDPFPVQLAIVDENHPCRALTNRGCGQ